MIAKKIVEKLISQNKTLAFAESVTGGGLSFKIVNIPNASKVFKGTIVSYQSEVKKNLLKVNEETIAVNTVVSEEVAIEMAINVKKLLDTNISLAITGNAGPSFEKATNEKICYIAIVDETEIKTTKYLVKSEERADALEEIIAFTLNYLFNEINA